VCTKASHKHVEDIDPWPSLLMTSLKSFNYLQFDFSPNILVEDYKRKTSLLRIIKLHGGPLQKYENCFQVSGAGTLSAFVGDNLTAFAFLRIIAGMGGMVKKRFINDINNVISGIIFTKINYNYSHILFFK
jgi:hypothetical protein